jgi:predicted dehydrogenase
MGSKKINVAIVGLGFGAEFIPIYQEHPHANMYAICQRDSVKLNSIGNRFRVAKRLTEFDEVIQDPSIDAVHINTPVGAHAPQTIAALRAGKHVACTIPSATTVEECWAIAAAAEQSGCNYMLMETTVYSREFLHLRALRDDGKLGRIQFLRGSHLQNMEGWPEYWQGYPPMRHATHCIGPCLALASGEAEWVSCIGSGRIAEHYIGRYGSPFAFESAHFKVRDQDVGFEVSRFLYGVARQYTESFDVYGEKMSFEWQRREGDAPLFHTGGERVESNEIPDYAHLLPESIRRFTTRGVYDKANQHLSFAQGSGHGGSHPHLVHEFVSSIVEQRPSFPDVYQSLNWTSAGLCAHDSAMRKGAVVPVPHFRQKR